MILTYAINYTFNSYMIKNATPNAIPVIKCTYFPDFGSYRLVVYSCTTNDAGEENPYFISILSPRHSTSTANFSCGLIRSSVAHYRPSKMMYFEHYTSPSNYRFTVSTRCLQYRSIATNVTTLLQA